MPTTDYIWEVTTPDTNLHKLKDAEAMRYIGTLGTGGTITTLPTASASNKGDTYKVITDGTYAGQEAHAGDWFTSTGSAWELFTGSGGSGTTYTFADGVNSFTVTPDGGTAQTVTVTPSITNNVTGSGTSGYLTKFNGANTITNGPQLGSSTTTYLRNDGNWATPPNDDTKNTAGSTDTSSKIFLIGATSQAANPQTYSDDQVYVTSGTLQTNITNASAGVNANTANSSTAGGLSLYATDPTQYGIIFRGTGNQGKHGYVQGDWATYFTMNAGSGVTNRGWVFRDKTTTSNVASISNGGNAAFKGSVTVGANEANTSGVRMVWNSSTESLDYVFAS